MNQEKIGKFIQQKRKEKKLSQMEFAEKLGVSNRTISKWENGYGMPDYSMINDLCSLLDISINELLSGEELSTDNYQKKLEENIFNTIDYNNKIRNKKIIKLILIILLFVVIYIIYKIFIISYYSSRNVINSYDREFPYVKNIYSMNIKNNDRANRVFNGYYEDFNFYLPDGFELVTDKAKSNLVQNECDLYLKNQTSKDNFAAAITICNRVDNIYNLARFGIEGTIFPLFDPYNVLEKNNINNTMDIIKYYEKHYNDKINIFTNSNKIKMNYIGKTYTLSSIGSYDNFYYLSGNINGYLIELFNNNKNSFWNLIYYPNDESSFSILFYNNNEDYFNHDNVLKIIESIHKQI